MSTSDKSIAVKLKHLAGYLFPFILMLLFLFIAFRGIDLNESLQLISSISIPWLILFLFIFFLSHMIRAFRWQVMIASVKKDVSVLSLFGATMIGYGVNCVFPRLGELYRPSFLGRWEGLSRSAMFGSIIVERVIDILILGLSVLLSVLIYPGELLNEIPEIKMALAIGFIGIGAAIVLIFMIVRFKENFYKVIINVVGNVSEKAAGKLGQIFSTLVDGFSTIKTGRSLLLTIVYSMFIMFFYGLNSYIGFYMMRMDEIMEVTLAMGWIVMTISAFGIVVPTPGGTGSYHAFSILSLSLFGFSAEVGGAYAILTHFISYVAFISATVFFVYYINRKKTGDEKVHFLNAFKLNSGQE